MCGTAEWEWDEDRFAYEPLEQFCKGCYLKTVVGEDTNTSPGITITLAPTNTIEHAKRIVQGKKAAARRDT